MTILGIDQISYGAADLDTCRRFFGDWGLRLVEEGGGRLVFECLNGCRVLVADPAHASLPAAISAATTGAATARAFGNRSRSRSRPK